VKEQVREMQVEGQAVIDNESRELLAVHHTGFIVAEAGQIYRGYTNSDHGIDGEIEFKDDQGRASGKRLVAADVRRLKPVLIYDLRFTIFSQSLLTSAATWSEICVNLHSSAVCKTTPHPDPLPERGGEGEKFCGTIPQGSRYAPTLG
jgi:hypothetical protein